MKTVTALQCVALALFLPFAAGAAPKIAICKFAGAGGKAAQTQLSDALCEEAKCAPAAAACKGFKPNPKKGKTLKVGYWVLGKSLKGGKSIEITVTKGAGKPKLKEKFEAKRGKLTQDAMANARDAIAEAIGLEGGGGEEPTEGPVTDDSAPMGDTGTGSTGLTGSTGSTGPDSTGGGFGDSSLGAGSSAPPPPAPEAEVTKKPEAPKKRGTKDPLFAIEVGPSFWNRNFGYDRPQTADLLVHQVGFFPGLFARAELFPLSMMGGALGGLGVEGSFGTVFGLKARLATGTTTYPSSMSRIDLGAKYKLRPSDKLDVAIIPALGFRSASFGVAAAADGSKIGKLPGVSFSAVRFGAGGEFGFADGKVVAFAGINYLFLLGVGEIISPTAFAAGSGSGIDGEVGAGFRILPALEARLTGRFTRYGITFRTAATDAFVAAGAFDQYLTLTASARYAF